jgi:hypothetical protein
MEQKKGLTGADEVVLKKLPYNCEQCRRDKTKCDVSILCYLMKSPIYKTRCMNKNT